MGACICIDYVVESMTCSSGIQVNSVLEQICRKGLCKFAMQMQRVSHMPNLEVNALTHLVGTRKKS